MQKFKGHWNANMNVEDALGTRFSHFLSLWLELCACTSFLATVEKKFRILCFVCVCACLSIGLGASTHHSRQWLEVLRVECFTPFKNSNILIYLQKYTLSLLCALLLSFALHQLNVLLIYLYILYEAINDIAEVSVSLANSVRAHTCRP